MPPKKKTRVVKKRPTTARNRVIVASNVSRYVTGGAVSAATMKKRTTDTSSTSTALVPYVPRGTSVVPSAPSRPSSAPYVPYEPPSVPNYANPKTTARRIRDRRANQFLEWADKRALPWAASNTAKFARYAGPIIRDALIAEASKDINKRMNTRVKNPSLIRRVAIRSLTGKGLNLSGRSGRGINTKRLISQAKPIAKAIAPVAAAAVTQKYGPIAGLAVQTALTQGSGLNYSGRGRKKKAPRKK